MSMTWNFKPTTIVAALEDVLEKKQVGELCAKCSCYMLLSGALGMGDNPGESRFADALGAMVGYENPSHV